MLCHFSDFRTFKDNFFAPFLIRSEEVYFQMKKMPFDYSNDYKPGADAISIYGLLV